VRQSKYLLTSAYCRLSEAVDVTIECDAQCISDVSEKHRIVLQSSPDYESVVSSLQEFDDCNMLCVSIKKLCS